MNTQSDRPSRRYLGIIAAVAVVLVVGLGLFLATRDSGSSADAAQDASATSTTTVGGSSDTSAPDAPGNDPTTTLPEGVTLSPESGFVLPAPEDLPLDVTVSNTTGLSDGDTVSVHVTPHEGSNIYGIEAFLCKPDTSYLLDADIRPTQTGKCVSKPLSEGSNDYLMLEVDPPYQSADVEFRVGVGSDTYDTNTGASTTVSCGPGQPCTLVLKLQIPDGFGFRAFPISFG